MFKRYIRTGFLTSAIFVSGFVAPAVVLAEEPGAAEKVTQEQVRKEADQNIKYLSGHALAKAKSLLESYDDFAPFGAGLFPGGKVRYVWAVKPGSKEEVNAALVLTAVRQALRAQAQNGAILGSAVVYQYLPGERAGESGEPQINVETEYLNGHAVVTATLYEQDEEGVVTFGAATQQEFEPRIFVPVEE